MVRITTPATLWLWRVLPLTVSLLLLFIPLLPLPLGGLRAIFPPLAWISLFYWTAYCPALLPFWLVALLGLVQDALYGQPLGLTSVCFLLLWWSLERYRHHLLKGGLLSIWMAFAFLSGLLFLLQWGLLSFHASQFMPPLPLLLAWGTLVLLYPAGHLTFSRLYYLSPFAPAGRHA